jgi:formate dehydrogenase major subunit
MLWHIFKNGWEDKQFIEQRVYGMDDIRKEVEKYPPDEVERITGVPGVQLERVARMFSHDKPACLIWAMGQTQHTVGTATVRASCILLLATGNVGGPGMGANIFRGHTNVQGATDLGLDITSLPLYYGLVEGAWRHWSRVWEVDYQWFVDRFDKSTGPDGKPTNTMNTPGIPSTRWFDATLYDKKDVRQQDNIKAMFVMGHGGNTVTRMPQAQKGIEKLELLVVCDPVPTSWAALAPARKNGTYLLPIATSYETAGSRTASNRAIQWGEQIVKPIFESKDDNEVMYLLAKKLGFADQMFKNIKVENNVPIAEDVLREINRGGWSTGYCGQSPARLKSHMANQQDFDMLTQKATAGPNKGDYYGLPWPCWGTPEFKHPGTPLLYNTNLSVKEGGGTFRARFGVEREETLPDGSKRKVSLLGNGYYSKDSEIKDGYPEFTLGVLKKLGWDKDLTEAELAVINKVNPTTPDAVSWSIDLSGGIQRVAIEHGCIPYGNGKARANAFGLPDAIPRIASRSTHLGPNSSPSIRLCRMPCSSGCRTSASTCRRRRWTRASPRTSRSFLPPGASSNTKAAARRRGPTNGSPSCSRTCSSRSILRTRPSAASRTAAGSGSPAPSSAPRPA